MQHSKQEREYALTVFGKCDVDYGGNLRRVIWHSTRLCAQVLIGFLSV